MENGKSNELLHDLHTNTPFVRVQHINLISWVQTQMRVKTEVGAAALL